MDIESHADGARRIERAPRVEGQDRGASPPSRTSFASPSRSTSTLFDGRSSFSSKEPAAKSPRRVSVEWERVLASTRGQQPTRRRPTRSRPSCSWTLEDPRSKVLEERGGLASRSSDFWERPEAPLDSPSTPSSRPIGGGSRSFIYRDRSARRSRALDVRVFVSGEGMADRSIEILVRGGISAQRSVADRE